MDCLEDSDALDEGLLIAFAAVSLVGVGGIMLPYDSLLTGLAFLSIGVSGCIKPVFAAAVLPRFRELRTVTLEGM